MLETYVVPGSSTDLIDQNLDQFTDDDRESWTSLLNYFDLQFNYRSN